MYKDHFGLKSNPFRSNAEGSGVFVGPTQTKVIARLHKALSAPDNIVTVSGPVGVGKTTIVTRALETNKQHQMVAWIGRMRLAADEVLQLLLAGLGVTRQVPGTVRQFAVFQRMLAERADADTRVVIVIEDALRIGNEALLELEAITATDSGNVGGANLILMGPPEIDKRLNFPELARLKQRSRMGQKIAALNAAEVQGYLKHSLRVAGRNYGELFDDDVASMLYRLSEGVPRVINNICDAALAAAAEANQDRVTRQALVEVAADVYGLEPVLDEPSPISDLEEAASLAEKSVDIEAIQAAEAITEPVPAPAPERLPDPEPVPATESLTRDPEPELAQVPWPDPAPEAQADIPPIVAAALAQEQDETPAQEASIEITGLTPELDPDTMQVENTDDVLSTTDIIPPPGIRFDAKEPEAFSDTADDLPMLSNSMRIDGPVTPAPANDNNEAGKPLAVDQQGRTRPAIPDLDALQTAINAARGSEEFIDKTDTHLPELNMTPPLPVAEIEPEPAAKLAPEPEPEPKPEIEPQAELEPRPEHVPEPELVFEPAVDPEPVAEAEPVPEPEITLDKSLDQSLEDQRVEGQKLDHMAAELANIDSIEDISDIMAETLFGIEFEQIAQEALKNPPAAGTLPGDPDDVFAEQAMASSETSIPANDPGEEHSPVMLDTENEEPVTKPTVSAPELQSQPEPDQVAQTTEPSTAPESIENQFQIEITQTMKTIDPANLPNPEIEADAENEKAGGLLGRLKKSFRG